MSRNEISGSTSIKNLLFVVLITLFLAPIIGLCYCRWSKTAAVKVVGVILAVLGVCGWGMIIGQETEGLVFVLFVELALVCAGPLFNVYFGTEEVPKSTPTGKQNTSKTPQFYRGVNRASNGGSFDPMEDLEAEDTVEDFYFYNEDVFANITEAEEAFDALDDKDVDDFDDTSDDDF